GLEGANSTEFDPGTAHPVVCMLDEQYSITDLGGTMRLGSYPCVLTEGSRAQQAYGSTLVHERHRHRYEFNNAYRRQFADYGFVVTGTSPDGQLVEVVELLDHPWFVAVQCHPEFKSKPTRSHSLFRGFVQASLGRRESKKNDSPRAPPPVSAAPSGRARAPAPGLRGAGRDHRAAGARRREGGAMNTKSSVPCTQYKRQIGQKFTRPLFQFPPC